MQGLTIRPWNRIKIPNTNSWTQGKQSMSRSHWQPGIWVWEDIATYTPMDALTQFRKAKGETNSVDSQKSTERLHVTDTAWGGLFGMDGYSREGSGQGHLNNHIGPKSNKETAMVNANTQGRWEKTESSESKSIRHWIPTTTDWISGPLPKEWGISIHIYHHQQHHHVALWYNTRNPELEVKT